MGTHFSVSGAHWEAIFAPWDHPGGPWEQQDGLEVVNNMILVDSGVILGLFMPVLGDKNVYKFVFCFGLCPGHFCIDF